MAVAHKIAQCQVWRNGFVEDSDQPDGVQLARFIQKDTAAREAVELTNRHEIGDRRCSGYPGNVCFVR
jgi:hypothetical protein